MRRGEVRLTHVGRKRRPVLVLTREEVLDVRDLVTVAEITTSERGLTVEVGVDDEVELRAPSVINCDGLYTVSRASLGPPLGTVSDLTLRRVCAAVSHAIGC